MEQPRHREAAAGEGGDGPGWSREPPESGGPAGGSAAWNGSCVRPPDEDGDDRERDRDRDWDRDRERDQERDRERDQERDLRFPSPDSPRCSCGCREEPAAAQRRDGSCSLACRCRPAPGLPEEDEEDGGDEAKGGRRPRRRQRHRSAPKERDGGGRREGGAGRRQRPAPRRSRGDGAESPGPAGSRWPLAAALAQARRLGAEAGERLLCSCCRLGAGEPGWAGAGVRSWGRRVGQRARSGSLRAARWLRAGARLLLRLLWMLSALLLLLAVLLLGCLRLCWRAGAAGAARLAGGRWVTSLRGTWGRLGGSPTCRNLWDWVRVGLPAAAAAPGAGTGAGEEVTRLVAMAEVPEEELNPFEVLGAEATASDAELRKAYRRLAVLVHPDKSEHPRAEAAFKVLRAAWDMVSTPERRREYELKRTAQTELTRSVSEFLSRLQEDLRDAMNTMMCSKCHGKHRRFEMERDPVSGRYCGECGGLHPAEEGDFWAESSLLGLKITYFAMMDGKIYDITEWAGCQRVGISPDTHRVPYHISFGARGPAPPGRQRWDRGQGRPPSAADLQDFLTHIFQGSSGAMPGGPFPPPPPPRRAQPLPPGAPPGEGAAPKGDPKHKRRKKARRPLQR